MKSRAVAPGDWAGAEEWVSNSRCQWHRPAVSNVSKRRQNEVVRQTRGCRVSSEGPWKGSSQLLSQGRGLGHKFSSQGGTGWREEES